MCDAFKENITQAEREYIIMSEYFMQLTPTQRESVNNIIGALHFKNTHVRDEK